MPDWRWVTQIKHTPSPGNTLSPIENGMWVDLDGLDIIMPLPSGRYSGANTRLGWMTANGWSYMFVAEHINPSMKGQTDESHDRDGTHQRSDLQARMDD